jgi:hypothetical protein
VVTGIGPRRDDLGRVALTVKAIRDPSGDQATRERSRPGRAMRISRPRPSAFMTSAWTVGFRPFLHSIGTTRRRPLGDQSGTPTHWTTSISFSVSAQSSGANARRAPVRRSTVISLMPREKAIVEPRGDQAGFEPLAIRRGTPPRCSASARLRRRPLRERRGARERRPGRAFDPSAFAQTLRRRDDDCVRDPLGIQALLVRRVAPRDAHPGPLVEPRRAGLVLRVDLEADMRVAALPERTKAGLQ